VTDLSPLPRSFYARDVLEAAPACLGKLVVHASPEGLAAGRIVECEAYRGPDDQAAHSHKGRRTARTEVMFGPPGHAYLFLLYGTSWALNLVTGEEGEPQVVLVRALEPVIGADLMAARRGFAPGKREISNGPGKLCRALGVDGRFYGADLTAGPLFVAEDPRVARGSAPSVVVAQSPRIHIEYAGDWVHRPWRYYERGNRYVSVPPRI
jgi:DNA-3-methyladenine glycosylase